MTNNQDKKKKEVEEMEKEVVQIEVTQFKDTCKICGKEIIGSTEGQVEHNMKVHKMTQHPSQAEK